jgi:hypothetical protein
LGEGNLLSNLINQISAAWKMSEGVIENQSKTFAIENWLIQSSINQLYLSF